MKKLILLFALVLLPVAASAQSGTTGDLAWSLSDGTLTISGTGAMPDYEDREDIAWYSHSSSITRVVIENGVTSIGEWAFSACYNLTSVSIGNNVTSIGSFAFESCSRLVSIDIPGSVTSIGGGAFINCNLTSVTIPASVTSIGMAVFNYCSSLTDIIVESGNAYYSSDAGVVFNKDKTVLITCPAGKSGDYTVPSSVTVIGDYAFFSCEDLTFITIPASVTGIGDLVFNNCYSLTSVTNLNPIPQNVDGSKIYGITLSNLTLYVPAEAVDAYKAASFWKDFGTIAATVIPSPSLSLSLSSVQLPASGGQQIFGITSNVGWTVNSSAFWLTVSPASGSNSGTITVTASANSGSVSRSATVTVSGSGITRTVDIMQAASGTPGGTTGDLSWSLSGGTLTISGTGAMADYSRGGSPWYGYREGITAVIIGNGVTGIGEYAFQGCSGLTSVTIPNSVTTIEENAFIG